MSLSETYPFSQGCVLVGRRKSQRHVLGASSRYRFPLKDTARLDRNDESQEPRCGTMPLRSGLSVRDCIQVLS